MIDFKVGDRVRRINEPWSGVKVGDTRTVLEIHNHNNIRLDGSVGTHMGVNLELASAAPAAPAMLLPSDPAARKDLPITSGVLDYFPLAIAEVARVSKAGNDQHNPGQPLHWDKTKSLDHADCIPRHLIDRGARDTDGQRHSAKLAWRALALLETQLQAERDAERG